MLDKETVILKLRCMPNEYPQILATKFPHILEKIVDLWQSPEADAYFTDLLQPNGRGGGRMDRDGFPGDAWDEISRLNMLYQKRKK